MVNRDFVLKIIFNMMKNVPSVCFFSVSILFVSFISFISK